MKVYDLVEIDARNCLRYASEMSIIEVSQPIIELLKENGFSYPLTEEQEIEFKLKYL